MPRRFLCSSVFMLLLLMLVPPLRIRADTPPVPTTEPAISIVTPVAGQALQGLVAIIGNTNLPGFRRAELSFAYMNDSSGTWFIIAESEVPYENTTLAQWDTTTITDGIYQLRLIVWLTGGEQLITSVPGIRVRNYTIVETETPTPRPTAQPGDTSIPTKTPSPTVTPIPPTATAIPPNPMIIDSRNLLEYLGQGALGVIAFFSLMGLYHSATHFFKKRSRE